MCAMGFIIGHLADVFGRRKMLLITMGLTGILHFFATFMQSFTPFLVFRFMVGLVFVSGYEFD